MSFSLSSPAEAQGIAISGTFYRQHFHMVPGEAVSSPDIYVVVFNHGEEELKVRLSSQAPPGVEVILPETEFTILPGDERRVEVALRVGADAVPGEYDLAVTARVMEEGEGIVISAGAQQKAKLSIFGEAGSVVVTTVTYDGEPFRSEIRLFYKQEGQLTPSGYSSTGDLDLRLVPGDYRVQAFYQGTEVARGDFSLRADERREITLTARTVSILGFSAVPNVFEDTGEIAFAKVIYSVKNIYRPEKNVKAILKVSLDGDQIEEAEIFAQPTLDLGKTSGSYQYIPAQRWQEGYYVFQMQLRSQVTDVLIAESREVRLRLVETKVGLKAALRSEFDLYPQGGQLTSSDGSVVIWAPPGAVDQAILVAIESAFDLPPPPKGFSLGLSAVTIEATSESGQPVVELREPVRICLAYTDEDLRRAGGDAARLYVGYHERAPEKWQLLDSEADPRSLQVCASTDHWSLWAVLIKPKGLPVWVLPVAICGGVLAATMLVLLAYRRGLLSWAVATASRYRTTSWAVKKRDRLSQKRVGSAVRDPWEACSRLFRQMRSRRRK